MSLPASLEPVGAAKAVALVSPNLALVRPVGMTDEMVDEWLTVAGQTLARYPLDILARGCEVARNTVSHHGGIVPAVCQYCDEALAGRRDQLSPYLVTERLEPPPKKPKLTHEEFERIVADRGVALSTMLDMGVIVSEGGGKFRLASDAA
jgi:hypothetical protein